MAVGSAPVRQQSYLTEYDRMIAKYLREMGAGIGARDIAAEAYGGKFPVGTMTAKILSGVLARGADRRAMNRDAQSKRAAVELMRTPQTEITEDTAVGDAIYDPNTDSYSTMSLAPLVAGVERQTRPEFESNEDAKKYDSLGQDAKTRLQQFGYIPQVLRDEYIPLNEREVLKPREFTAGMTIPGSAESPNWVERKLGDVEGKTVSSRAELADLAGYDALQFSDYERNKIIQNRTLELAEQERKRALQPQFKSQKTYYTSTGEPTIVNMFIDPKTNMPIWRGEVNELIDISNLSPDKPDLGENIVYTLTNAQRTEANNLGLNFPSNATVKFKFRKDFNPEGKSLQQLITNTVSQDWKQPLKDSITKIYTGSVPQTTLNKLSDTITNSFGELVQGASLISSLRDIPVTGGYGEFVDVLTGTGALIDGFTGSILGLEDLLTEKLTGVTTEEFGALRTEMQLYLAASIEAITGEESGRYTAAEQKIAREALASKDMWKGSPGKAYGALQQIMSIQELARDRAEIQLAHEEAKQNNTEFVDPFPYTKANLKIYALKLKKLGLDARTIKKVIKQSMLGRELIADYYNR